MPRPTRTTALAVSGLLAALIVVSPAGPGAAATPGRAAAVAATSTAVPAALTQQRRSPAARSRHKAARLLVRINKARATARRCGDTRYPAAKPLKPDRKLDTAAYRFARNLAKHDYFDHTGRNGSSPTDRANAAGYRHGVGENIAAGYGTVGAVVAGWLHSPGHCSNIMNRQYRHLGSGYRASTTSTYSSYWVQDFGVA